MNLELPFGCVDSAELDEYLGKIDEALDDCFLADLDDALGRAGAAQQDAGEAAAAP